ncbi:MAG: valS [Rickettsiaceae bacterium]|jgi:valyl-tRNA synthetase|nr:valS [Rickettsiaceae bacterium]
MKPLPQNYNHAETEKKWQKTWEEQGVYAWDESESRENTYVIDTPPPTVSGLLHMGHVFSYTQADFVARYQRMAGKTVFYPMGFDDNGLPTERLVEKVKKVRATDMSREEFIQLCEGVTAEARLEFRALFESIALSVDWRQEYHTISEDSRRISQLSFLDLFEKDRAYRKLLPMHWDPVDQTAIAQAEVEDKEMPSQKNYINFGLEGDSKKLEIMTTRPELLGACVAVMYNPNDERYQLLKGKKAVTPIFGVKVPLIADEKVDMEKGTGLVMCCTFGDETDIAWWREHGLNTRVLLNKYGKIDVGIDDEYNRDYIAFFNVGKADALFTESGPVLYSGNTININKTISAFKQIQGLKCRTDARAKMLELLASEGAIYKEPEVGVHAEPCAERSGSPLEYLITNQWFVKILDQKEELKAKAAECNWYPEYMKVRMDQWIDGLSWDWCISRQRYFGVPFPVWYSKRAGEEGKIIIADADQLPVNPLVDLPKGYSRDEVIAEADVMDTWATSSVSPQLSSKGINAKYAVDAKRHSQLFPADLRPQAHEIIRTWAFYTVVKAHLHDNTIPWKNLMISGWCLASDKTKMSKSKGNVVTPVSLVEEKGSDVVRFWASTSRLGADTAYSEDVLKIGKKLVTKLWNATKFAAIHLDKLQAKPGTAKEDVEKGAINQPLDLWVLTRLNKTIKKATEEFDKYEYCDARVAAEDFFWNDFCDNYLELVKVRVYGESGVVDKAAQMSAVHTIYHCLDGILRLFAPIVPHITEELYSHIFDEKAFINARGTWPKYNDYPIDLAAEKSGIACVSVLNAVRKVKADRNVSVKWPLNFIAITGDSVEQKIRPLAEDLKNVTNASDIVFSNKDVTDGQGLTIETSDGVFTVAVEFAKENSAVTH